MAINLARFATDSGPRWGVVQRNGIVPLSGGLSDHRGADRAR